MIWGGIAYENSSKLMFIRGTMNAQHYVDEVVEPDILPYIQQLEDCSRLARISLNRLEETHINIVPWAYPQIFRPLANLTTCKTLYAEN